MPEDAADAYSEAPVWRNFNQTPMDFSGINDPSVSTTKQKTTVYNLKGIKVFEGDLENACLPKGTYIIVHGTTVTKRIF